MTKQDFYITHEDGGHFFGKQGQTVQRTEVIDKSEKEKFIENQSNKFIYRKTLTSQ